MARAGGQLRQRQNIRLRSQLFNHVTRQLNSFAECHLHRVNTRSKTKQTTQKTKPSRTRPSFLRSAPSSTRTWRSGPPRARASSFPFGQLCSGGLGSCWPGRAMGLASTSRKPCTIRTRSWASLKTAQRGMPRRPVTIVFFFEPSLPNRCHAKPKRSYSPVVSPQKIACALELIHLGWSKTSETRPTGSSARSGTQTATWTTRKRPR